MNEHKPEVSLRLVFVTSTSLISSVDVWRHYIFLKATKPPRRKSLATEFLTIVQKS
jgi:hypothetical protein